MFKRIDHVEIVTDQLDPTVQFYTEVLGFRVKARDRIEQSGLGVPIDLVYLDLGGTVVELISYEGASIDPAPEKDHLGYQWALCISANRHSPRVGAVRAVAQNCIESRPLSREGGGLPSRASFPLWVMGCPPMRRAERRQPLQHRTRRQGAFDQRRLVQLKEARNGVPC